MQSTLHTISRYFLFFTTICLFMPQQAFGKPEFLSRIPNSNTFSCFTCHTTSIPARNPFGSDFDKRGKAWSSTLAGEDSDTDGHTNGEELLDPNGTWREGQPNPGNSANVTNPGVGDVFPTATSTTAPTHTNSPVTPTLTPTPTFTSTTTSSPTYTLSPQLPTSTVTSTAPPTNTPTTTSTPTNTSLEGTPTKTPSITTQPTSTNTEQSVPTPTSTETAPQEPTSTQTEINPGEPTPTVTATELFKPTPTGAGPCREIEIEGEISAIDLTTQTITVLGYTVQITTQTSIRGEDEESREKDDGNDDDDHIRLSFDDLSVGDRVEVEGVRCGDVIEAEKIEVEHHHSPSGDCDRELHGVITEITHVIHTLVVGLVRLETNSLTQVINSHGEKLSFNDLKIGDRVELKYCVTVSGTPIATKIKLEDREERERVLRIEGKISAIDFDRKVLTVRGVEIQAGEAMLIGDDNESFDFGDLAINEFVRVRGYYDQRSVAHATHVFRKKRRGDDCNAKIRGYVNKIYDTTMTIVVGVIEIRVDANTRIEDDRVEGAVDFSILSVGLPVKVVYCRGTGVPVATKIEIKRAGDMDLDDDGSICGKDLVLYIRHGEDEGVSLDLNGDDLTTCLDLFMLSTRWQQTSK